jgi:hypothetical protein
LRILHHGHDERTAAGDDLEDPIAHRPALDSEAGHDQRLVGRGHLPQHLEQDRQQQRDEDDGGDDHDQRGVHGDSSGSGVTSTLRGGS